MRCRFGWCACALVLALSAGCANMKLTSGNTRRLQLGQTTEAQARGVFGKPQKVEERSDAGGASKLIRWLFNSGARSNIGYNMVDLRFLDVDFFNDRARAWLYVSTAPKDSTKIRSSALPLVVKGRTTRDEVLRLLGEPAGRALRGTLIPDYASEFGPGVTEIWQWAAVDGSSGWFVRNYSVRVLLVKFDASGRVVDTITRTIKGGV